MEPAPGRRLPRPAVTLWVAPPALTAVWVWGDPALVRPYCAFVAVTAAALVVVAPAVRLLRWS